MKKLMILISAVVLTVSIASCGKNREANQKTGADDQVKVLAMVNGAPITELDVRQIAKRAVGPGESLTPEATQNILQALVRDELIYQKALELGLDKKPEYRRKLNEYESQLRAFQRQEMAVLYRRNVQENADVTDLEAQEYFNKNAKMMQAKFHVLQIFYKRKYPEIAKDHEDIKSGMSFEKVAARRFPGLPKNMKAPWELGELTWSQMPPAWQGIVDRLEPGQVSDIIKGEGERFWLIKLAKKTVDPQITFATEKARIVEVLRQQRSGELYKRRLAEMKEKAKIVYPK